MRYCLATQVQSHGFRGDGIFERNHQYQEAIAIAKAELQSQQQLASIREDFVSTLSHDLKTPMLGAI
jgi:signal transduction histidine kinase